MDTKRKVLIAFVIIIVLALGTFFVIKLTSAKTSAEITASTKEEGKINEESKTNEKVTSSENNITTDNLVTNNSTQTKTKKYTKLVALNCESEKTLNNPKEQEKVIVDTKGPEIAFEGGSRSFKKPSNENITIKLADVSEVSKVSYLITQSNDNKGNYGEEVAPEAIVKNLDGTYSVIVDVTGKNGGYYIFVKATDKLGNISTKKSGHYYIDTKGPEITFEGGSKSYSKPSNENITIKLSDKSDLNAVSYLITQSYDNKGNYGEEVAPEAIIKNSDGTYSITVDVTGKNGGYYIFVKATDKLGNISTKKSEHYYIDAKGPEVTFEGGSRSYSKPSNQNITIKLSDRSDLQSVSYLITQSYDNKGNYGEEVAPEVIIKNPDGTYSIIVDVTGKNGGYYIFVKATDKLGNISTTKGGHFYIDTTAPEITFAGGSKSYSKPSKENITMNIVEKNLLKVSYLITQSYDNKGNYGEEVAPEAIIKNPDGTYSVNIDVTGKEGGYYIFAKVTDVAGNETTEKSGHYYIDAKGPEVTFEGGSKSYKNPSNENITINLSDRSDLQSVSYLITQSYDNKGNYGEEVAPENIIENPDGTYSITVDVAGKNGGYYIFVKAIDKLGNITTTKAGHFYIDTTEPEITFTGGSKSSKNYSNSSITMVIKEKSNIDSVSYLVKQGSTNKGYGTPIDPSNIIDNGDGTYSVNIDISNRKGGYYIFAKVIDVAGNETTQRAGNFYIDTQAPTASIEYSTTAPTESPVDATLVPSEDVTVTNNEGSLTHTFTENGEFTFEFVDKAGNEGSATATVNNINPII